MKQQQIPGPRSVFGWRMNMLRFQRNPFHYSRWLYETYGNLVALGKGSKPSYVFAFGPEFNEKILTNPDLFVASTSLLKIPKDSLLGQLFFNNLALMTGQKHKQQRRLMQPSFHRQQIVSYCQDMVELTKRMCDRWEGRSKIELNAEMKKLTQHIAVKTLFGLYNEEELEKMGSMIERMTKSLIYISIAPFRIPGTPYYRTLKLAEQLDAQIRSMIAAKRSDSKATDVLASLIKARDEDGTKLSEEELVGHAFTLYTAGHETTANALTWSIFLLSQHPSILRDLLDELEGALGTSELTLEKLGSLTLLEGVVKESLRLLPPAGIGVRMTNEDCELGGYYIPKGTNVFFNQMITHRLPDLYEEPDRFKPDRWANLKRSPYEYLPFSAGQHMCIGWSFATQEMKVILALLLRKYRFAVIPNTKISPNLMMRPIHGMPMNIIPQDKKFTRVPVRGKITSMIE